VSGQEGGTGSPGARRILLVAMPLAEPQRPNLAIEQLAAIARRAGQACDTLQAMLLMPRRLPQNFLLCISGPAIFAPDYHGLAPEEVAAEVVDDRFAAYGRSPGAEEREGLITQYLIGMDAADECLDRCMAAIPAGRYDVVGFSVGFDIQKLPSAALARRLKAREPRLRIVFGGTGCDEAMGPALLEVFPEVDAVVQGEAEHTFLPAVAALRGEQPLAGAPSVVHRDGARIVCNPEAPFPRDMDEIPAPDYDDYLRQRAASDYGSESLTLLFETSRGCWWGEKHHCKFCGIRAVGRGYRARSAAGAADQIQGLATRYNPRLLYSTDSIMDLGHLRELLPDLARRRREGLISSRFFYEIKSNVRREQVALMAAAGIKGLQPGIESLSTHVLRLVDKGTTALQQVEMLKWARTYDIVLVYGLITGIPGETPEDYRAMLELIPRLHHLPPPTSANPLGLHRFSPHFADPAAFGIADVRPFQIQRLLYRASPEVLTRLCYLLDYTVPAEPAGLRELRDAFRTALARWRAEYRAGARLNEARAGGAVILTRCHPAEGLRVTTLRGREAAVYDACTHVTSPSALARRLGITEEEAASAADALIREGLLVEADGRLLALGVPEGADAYADAGLCDGADARARSVAVRGEPLPVLSGAGPGG
jgi:ribosomal peptide maturation radical SAM protein 1